MLVSGPTATTHAARDLALGRDVVVRVLAKRPRDAEGFATEAKAAAALEHPGILRLLDWSAAGDEAGGRPFYVFDRALGGSLADLLAASDPPPWPAQRSLAFIGDLAEALGAAHAVGLVHGGIDADRVLLSVDNQPRLEFPGLPPRDSGAATIAPEVRAGESPTASSDLYAVGGLLHLLLTGRPYAPGAQIAAPIGVEAGAAGLMAAMLADEPKRRPPSARAVAGRLRALARETGGPTGRVAAGSVIETIVEEAPARRRLLDLPLLIAFAVLVGAGVLAAYELTHGGSSSAKTTPTATTVVSLTTVQNLPTATIPTSTIDTSTLDTSTIDTSTIVPSTLDTSTIDTSTIVPSTIVTSTTVTSTIATTTVDTSTVTTSTPTSTDTTSTPTSTDTTVGTTTSASTDTAPTTS